MEVYDDNKNERTNINATPIKVEIPQIGSNSNITKATAGRGNSKNRFGPLPYKGVLKGQVSCTTG